MRRTDREITDFAEITDVMRRCDVCRIALNDTDFPYILPLNFGMEVTDGRLALYFHGAGDGYKYTLIGRDDRTSFEADCSHRLVIDDEGLQCTMEYESVIGCGRISFVEDESEKLRALGLIMEHYGRSDFPVKKNVADFTCVMRLDVFKCTGKRRLVKA